MPPASNAQVICPRCLRVFEDDPLPDGKTARQKRLEHVTVKHPEFSGR